MSLSIAGLGTAVPGEPIPQGLAGEVARRYFEPRTARHRMVDVLYRWTKVDTRYSVLKVWPEDQAASSFLPPWSSDEDRGPTTARRMERYESEAPQLAERASADALAEAGYEPGSITHLVTVSCSGFNAPGVDVHLIRRLGLDEGVARSHIGFMGCHAALNGLRVARSFADADPGARVLLCAVELCSLHYSYGWDPEKVVANAIFSDGAAALVGTVDGNEAASTSASGNGAPWRVTANGSQLLENCEDAMTWKVRDHGFEMTLSPRVPDLIQAHVKPWLEQWLAKQELTIDQVGSWAVHPGGPRILDAFAEAVGLDNGHLTPSFEVLGRYGNMSSPTVLFLLKHLRDQNAPRPAVAMGFGPGLAIEAALIR